MTTVNSRVLLNKIEKWSIGTGFWAFVGALFCVAIIIIHTIVTIYPSERTVSILSGAAWSLLAIAVLGFGLNRLLKTRK